MCSKRDFDTLLKEGVISTNVDLDKLCFEDKLILVLRCRDTDTDKLRNLSVSSADFNYDPNNIGGSVPG